MITAVPEIRVGHWSDDRALTGCTVILPPPGARVPVVPAAVIYDLGIGDPSVRPGPGEGYAACEAASTDESREGNVGAGMGATVGKTAGFDHQSRGGVGGAARRAYLVRRRYRVRVVDAPGPGAHGDGRADGG